MRVSGSKFCLMNLTESNCSRVCEGTGLLGWALACNIPQARRLDHVFIFKV